ncbi:MAG: tRNA 2-selenouridine(34) synthase MnmH [Rubritalea sp.]|uniref:tRNA 2-selenouridine(34) synthase MnmH n=1 Tax=Rubritalea sp. TaxID=2109375 RepID=UPI003242E9F3
MYFLDSITLPSDLSTHAEIIDVRSPSEFAIDHIPGSINIPVLNDEERVTVGTLYNESPFEARKLGAGLIAANASKALAGHFADKELNYNPLLYCWRGGMRSRSLTHILSSIGFKAYLLKGGYRSFRKFIVDDLNRILTETPMKLTVLSGLTGVGKTRMLHALQKRGEQILDLEGLANHKGSLLGSPQVGEQPSQKQFETRLWHTLQAHDPTKKVWTEAESNRIGNVHCPPVLWKKLSQSKLIELKLSITERCILLREDYPHFCANPTALTELLEVLKRLRGDKQVRQWQEQIANADWESFLQSILVDHYDLSYRKPTDKKSIYSAPLSELTVESASLASYSASAEKLVNLSI